MKTKALITSILLSIILVGCGPSGTFSEYNLSPNPLYYGDCAPAPMLTFSTLYKSYSRDDALTFSGKAFYTLIGSVSSVSGETFMSKEPFSTLYKGTADISADMWVFGGTEGRIDYKITIYSHNDVWFSQYVEKESDRLSVPVLPCEATSTPTATLTLTPTETFTPMPTDTPKKKSNCVPSVKNNFHCP